LRHSYPKASSEGTRSWFTMSIQFSTSQYFHTIRSSRVESIIDMARRDWSGARF